MAVRDIESATHAVYLLLADGSQNLLTFEITPEEMLAGFRKDYHVLIEQEPFGDGLDLWTLFDKVPKNPS